jgi:hypothetical protein
VLSALEADASASLDQVDEVEIAMAQIMEQISALAAAEGMRWELFLDRIDGTDKTCEILQQTLDTIVLRHEQVRPKSCIQCHDE